MRSPSLSTNAGKRAKSAPARKNRGITLARFPGIGFPPRLQAKLKYAAVFTVQSTAGAIANYQFRCNGMYDPDYTSTGHQPLYFDQFNAIYDHWTVLRAYLKLTLVNSTSASAIVNVFQNDDTTVTPTSMENRIEQSKGKSIVVNSSANPQVMYLTFDAYQTFGGSVLGNPNLQGTPAGDPTEQSVWTISVQCPDLVTTTAVTGTAEIVYEAVFDELKDIAGS